MSADTLVSSERHVVQYNVCLQILSVSLAICFSLFSEMVENYVIVSTMPIVANVPNVLNVP